MLTPRRISTSHRDAFLERYDGLHAWVVQMTAGDRALAEDLLHGNCYGACDGPGRMR